MLKIPSIKAMALKAMASFQRFPLAIISSMLAASIAMYIVETEPRKLDFTLFNSMLTFALGIPLSFSAAILAERSTLNKYYTAAIYIGATIVLILIYVYFPDDESAGSLAIPYIRYLLYNISIHLLVSFIPYLQKGNYNGFWQYNKALFLRILEAILYSGFLFAGLALAMGSLQLLFSIDLDEKLYAHLFIFIVGFFNTWFFVSDIPKNFEELQADENYPNSLKVFTQYILLPLLSVYLIILYSYGIKIVALWDWPQGIVSYLIICVAVVGIFLVLLLYPYQRNTKNNWVKLFSTIYYYSLIPLIIMLFIAIGIRIGDYGITINRYIIVLLGVWLAMACTYYIIKKQSIKFIPMSLAAVLVLTSFGPWGMFAVSEGSQHERLRSIFEEAQLLNNEKLKYETKLDPDDLYQLVKANEGDNDRVVLSDSLHNEVKSILDYLDDFHDLSSLDVYFNQNIDSLIAEVEDSMSYINRSRIYMQAMGLDYYRKTISDKKFYSYSSKLDNVIPIMGFDYMFNIYVNSLEKGRNQKFFIEESTYQPELNDTVFRLIGKSDTVSIDLKKVLKKLNQKYGNSSAHNIPSFQMSLTGEGDLYNIELRIKTMNFSTKEKTQLTAINASVFLKKKN